MKPEMNKYNQQLLFIHFIQMQSGVSERLLYNLFGENMNIHLLHRLRITLSITTFNGKQIQADC